MELQPVAVLQPTGLSNSKTRWNLCIICQKSSQDLRESTEYSFKKFKESFETRKKFSHTSQSNKSLDYTDYTSKDLFDRLLGEIDDLSHHQVKWHKRCYAVFTNKANIKCIENRFRKQQIVPDKADKMTIRWGIVCAGKICHDFVNSINSYPDKGDQVVAAVAARNKDRAAEFAKLHNIPKIFDSYEALAASKDIDVAYIGALNPDHYALTKLFLENGKHVLCEKPLCLNYKQSQSLVKLAKAKKLFFMEAVWSRFSPAYITLENDIKDGKLGEIKFLEVNFGVPIKYVDRVNKKEFGGSALLDIGIYTLQLSQYVFKDEPVKVSVIGEPLNEYGVDTMETVVLEYEGGRRAVLNINANIRMWNKATIYGTKGRVTLEDPFHFPTELIKEGGKREQFPLHESAIPYNFDNSAGLVYEALETVRCIKNGLLESPRMPHKESLTLAKLEDTIRKQIGVHFDVDEQEFP